MIFGHRSTSLFGTVEERHGSASVEMRISYLRRLLNYGHIDGKSVEQPYVLGSATRASKRDQPELCYSLSIELRRQLDLTGSCTGRPCVVVFTFWIDS